MPDEATLSTPVLHIGVDIGYKRDTSAVAAVGLVPELGIYCLWAHQIWQAPVHIPDVTAYIEMLIKRERVAGIWFDPNQWAAEAQRLGRDGHGRILKEVNQSGPFMIQIATNLQTLIQRGDVLLYDDVAITNAFAWCGAKMTEAGPRIIKSAQTKQIDFVVAYAMSVWGASQDSGDMMQQQYHEESHVVQVGAL
jgi:phage terminase large subunit-like protein